MKNNLVEQIYSEIQERIVSNQAIANESDDIKKIFRAQGAIRECKSLLDYIDELTSEK